jgi:hypothetical protein
LKAGVILGELKRRKVLQAGAFYAAAVWALAQGIAQLETYFGAPDWTVRWFVIASIIRFRLWLAFAWFYDFTPTGLKRESGIAPVQSMQHFPSRTSCRARSTSWPSMPNWRPNDRY